MLDKDAEFVPETIEVIDPVTDQVVAGPFMLVERPDFGLCVRFASPGDKFYETEGIDPSLLPPDFRYRKTQVPFFIYRVTVRERTGEQRIMDIVEPPFFCRSASQ